MSLWLVTLSPDRARHEAALAALVTASDSGAGPVDGIQLGDGPDRVALDAALDAADGRRVVVHSDLPDLSALLRRMMRRDEMARTETGVLPFAAVPFLGRHGIGPRLTAAAGIAANAPCRTVGVLKDDSGTLVLDHATLRPWTGSRLWVRAYVDDERLCDGEIRALTIERDKEHGLLASVRTRLGRSRTLAGRGLALACDDAAISSDGADRDQPRRKRIWWDEPGQWRLASGRSD